MPVSDRLSQSLHLALGDEPAADLVDWMQRVDGTTSDLRELSDLQFERLDARLTGVRHELRADIAEHRRETRADIVELRQHMDSGFSQVRADAAALEIRLTGRIEQRFSDLIKWSFVFWVGAVLAGMLGRR